jgi:hypothetical protein
MSSCFSRTKPKVLELWNPRQLGEATLGVGVGGGGGHTLQGQLLGTRPAGEKFSHVRFNGEP